MNDDDNDDDFIALRKYFIRSVYTKRIVVSCFKQITSQIFTTVVNVCIKLFACDYFIDPKIQYNRIRF